MGAEVCEGRCEAIKVEDDEKLTRKYKGVRCVKFNCNIFVSKRVVVVAADVWTMLAKLQTKPSQVNTCKEPEDGSYNDRGWVKTLVFLKVAKCNFSDKLFWSTKFGIKIWLLLNWIKSFQLTRDALKFYSSKSMHGRDLEHSYKTFFAVAGIPSLSGYHQKSLIPIAIWYQVKRQMEGCNRLPGVS